MGDMGDMPTIQSVMAEIDGNDILSSGKMVPGEEVPGEEVPASDKNETKDSPEDAGDFELPDLDAGFSFGNLDPAGESGTDVMADLVAGLKDDIAGLKENKAGSEIESTLQKIETQIRDKYGDVDPTLAREFTDVLELAKKTIVPNLEIAQEQLKVQTGSEIEALKQELAALKETVAKQKSQSEDPAVQVKEYMSVVESTYPEFGQMMRHPQFPALLKQPVSDMDPSRTWDHAISDIIARRNTGALKKFTKAFHSKYGGKPKKVVTVPTSGQDPTRQVDFDVAKAMKMLQDHTDGVRRLLPDQRAILTTGLRKAAVKDPELFNKMRGG